MLSDCMKNFRSSGRHSCLSVSIVKQYKHRDIFAFHMVVVYYFATIKLRTKSNTDAAE